MGKKGDALRAEKAKRVTYTFTAEQLKARDAAQKKAIIEEYRKLAAIEIGKMKAEMEKEYFYKLLSYMLALASRVLVEVFGWTPMTKRVAKNMRLARFADAVIDELGRLADSSDASIKKYNDETYEKYGVKFVWDD